MTSSVQAPSSPRVKHEQRFIVLGNPTGRSTQEPKRLLQSVMDVLGLAGSTGNTNYNQGNHM